VPSPGMRETSFGVLPLSIQTSGVADALGKNNDGLTAPDEVIDVDVAEKFPICGTLQEDTTRPTARWSHTVQSSILKCFNRRKERSLVTKIASAANA
jgi:hypothetical protein